MFGEVNRNVKDFWDSFLLETGKNVNTEYIECFHFERTEELANRLLELVLSGQKQATSSSLYAYEIEGDRIPQQGDYSIVTDWVGTPRCVIETTAVTVLPFNKITYEICKREGEDDTLESWRDGHIRFFIHDGKELGYTFSEDMPVVFEDFRVVFVK